MSQKVYVCYWDNGEMYEDHESGVAAICTTENKARGAAQVYLMDKIQLSVFCARGYHVDVVEQELNLFVYDQYNNLFTGKYITRYEIHKKDDALTVCEKSR